MSKRSKLSMMFVTAIVATMLAFGGTASADVLQVVGSGGGHHHHHHHH